MRAGVPATYVDFHVHLFPDRLQRAIRTWFRENAGWHLPFQGGWERAVEFLEGVPQLERYLCCGYAHKPGIAAELNRFYAEVPGHSPKAVALGCAHPDDADLAGLAERAMDAGLVGFKIHCQVQQVAPDDPRLRPLYRVAAERGGLILLHGGTGPFSSPHTGFDRVEPLLRRFPDLTIVVAHLGCFEEERFLTACLDYHNLYLDTAYTFIPNPANRMAAPLDGIERARDKILFATDFPGICHSYDDGVRAIADLPLSEPARAAIFAGNARRLLEPWGKGRGRGCGAQGGADHPAGEESPCRI